MGPEVPNDAPLLNHDSEGRSGGDGCEQARRRATLDASYPLSLPSHYRSDYRKNYRKDYRYI